MPPSTRGQAATAREAVATTDAPPKIALANPDEVGVLDTDVNGRTGGMRMRQEASVQFGPQQAFGERADTDGRSRHSGQSDSGSGRSRTSRQDEPDKPPRFVIDLSLPPEQRYLAVCSAFQTEIAELVPLFDEVVGGMLHFIPLEWLHRFCKLILRGVYDNEENAELEGISKATGVSMYLLVCFNVLLDLFMGCSSGGAAVRASDEEEEKGKSKMVHFRTLDWGMPSLRRVVVQLDFVLEKDGPVFATSITYAGYVGVLTGVRQGISMSLNYRPNRVDNGVFWADAKYVWHLLCVLLGWRRSICSTLRGFLLPRRRTRNWMPFRKTTQASKTVLPDYAGILREMSGGETSGQRPITTTACYLCFSNGQEATVIEKDRISAKARSGDEFIVVTNTDGSPPSTPDLQPQPSANEKTTFAAEGASDGLQPISGLVEIVAEAQDRQECAFHNWRNLQSSQAREQQLQHITSDDRKRLASVDDVVQMVQKYPTTNECTHFAAVMDPVEGKLLWCRRWKEPVSARWIRAHMSST